MSKQRLAQTAVVVWHTRLIIFTVLRKVKSFVAPDTTEAKSGAWRRPSGDGGARPLHHIDLMLQVGEQL